MSITAEHQFEQDEIPAGDNSTAPSAYVTVQVKVPRADADRLAQHRADRLAQSLDVLADEAKELARPIMDALVAAGYGQ